jgi:hypothetical protein
VADRIEAMGNAGCGGRASALVGTCGFPVLFRHNLPRSISDDLRSFRSIRCLVVTIAKRIDPIAQIMLPADDITLNFRTLGR